MAILNFLFWQSETAVVNLCFNYNKRLRWWCGENAQGFMVGRATGGERGNPALNRHEFQNVLFLLEAKPGSPAKLEIHQQSLTYWSPDIRPLRALCAVHYAS